MAHQRISTIKKRILITGASSFLGRELISALKANYEITLLEHNKSLENLSGEGVRIIHGGLKNISTWGKHLSGIEVIIHLAGITHSRDSRLYEDVNALGTRNLITSAEKEGVKRLVFISTRAIGAACGAYGASKEKAESYLKESKLEYVILRIGEVYDEKFTNKEGLGSIATLLRKSIIVPYITSNFPTLAPIHKDDVTEYIKKVVDNPETNFKTYIISGPENLSMKEIIIRMARHMKTKRLLVPIPAFMVSFYFSILSNILKKTVPDQLQRFLCEKESLSENVLSDLKIKPRRFLIS